MPSNPFVLLVLSRGVGFVVGLLIVLLCGPAVKRLLDAVKARADYSPPPGATKRQWMEAVEIPEESARPVRWLGTLERLFFYLCFCLPAFVLAAGWLAFKVASKWETWQSIIRVPESCAGDGDPLEYFKARNRLGSTTLQRWLIGTLANVLAGMCGAGCSVVVDRLVSSCFG